MVYCRHCQRKVEDCAHCVFPIKAPRIRVYDEKVDAVAYAADDRTLEIVFKSGQVWQLFNVPDGIYKELKDSTISSFLRFVARRYAAAPVKQGFHAVVVPETEACLKCRAPMRITKKTGSIFKNFATVFWECPSCKASQTKVYGGNEERGRRSKLAVNNS
jgi:hypothetical protein